MVDTFLVGSNNEEVHCHRAYCQIKVFKVRWYCSSGVSCCMCGGLYSGMLCCKLNLFGICLQLLWWLPSPFCVFPLSVTPTLWLHLSCPLPTLPPSSTLPPPLPCTGQRCWAKAQDGPTASGKTVSGRHGRPPKTKYRHVCLGHVQAHVLRQAQYWKRKQTTQHVLVVVNFISSMEEGTVSV